jgi:hypothetical protein
MVVILLSLLLAATFPLLPGGCPNQQDNGGGTTQDEGSNGSQDGTAGDTQDETTDDTQDGTTDDTQNDGTDGTDNGGNGTAECGIRTVSALPDAEYLKYAAVAQVDATPADSTLAKVMFQAALCPSATTTTALTLYQLDATGVVLAIWSLTETGEDKVAYSTPVTGEQLVIEDRCLQHTYETTVSDETDPNEVLHPHENPCGEAAMSVSRDGLDWEPTGDYICVEVHATSACRDCWAEGGIWHEQLVTTGYYVSLGTLDGISLYGWAAVCDPDHVDATGTITTGDRVDFTWTYTTEYEMSASPAELGYQQIVTTP